MNIANLYRKIKQILEDSNEALINKGFNRVDSLYQIPSEINKLEINTLPYVLSREVIEITERDLLGATNIRKFAFDRQECLENIIIPDTVVSIDAQTFDMCSNLVSVTIGSGITSIGGYAFFSCDSLANMYFKLVVPPTLGNSNSIPSNSNLTIHVPVGSGDAYKTATNWSVHADKIVEDIVVE